jgi:hypothetical protein
MLTQTMSHTICSLCVALGAGIFTVPSLASQTIEGHVINAVTGEGVAGVSVRIFRDDDPQPYSTATDAQGRFRIDGAKAGTYRATYLAPGFRPMINPSDRPPAFAVIDGGEPVRLEVKLEPMARFSGRVLDSAGKPVPNAAIWLIRQDKRCMPPDCYPEHRQSKASENGEFTVTDLVPGPWLVSATAPPSWDPPPSRGDERLGWAQTFYPGVTDPQFAQAVMLQPGSQWITDIKLATAPLHRIRGRLLDPRGDPVAKALIALDKGFGFGPTFTKETNADGTFEFAAVDDQWGVSAAVDRDGVKLKCTQAVDLKDHDSEGVEMRLSAPFTLHGKIVMEVPTGVPAPEPPQLDIGLVPTAPAVLSNGPTDFIPIETDGGNLTVRNIYPGSYRVQFLTDSPVPFFLDSIRLGEQDAVRSFSVDSASLPLTIRFRLGGGTVTGTIEACDSHDVFLVPQDAALRLYGFIRKSSCDRNGHFEFLAVRPGKYYGIARKLQSSADLLDDRVLSQGNEVTVRENENTSADFRISER